MSRFNSRCGTSISICNQPPRSTQPGHPFVGRHNEHQPTGGDALQLGRKAGMARVWVACPLVTHRSYLSALEVRHDKALHKFTLLCFTLLYSPPQPSSTTITTRPYYCYFCSTYIFAVIAGWTVSPRLAQKALKSASAKIFCESNGALDRLNPNDSVPKK